MCAYIYIYIYIYACDCFVETYNKTVFNFRGIVVYLFRYAMFVKQQSASIRSQIFVAAFKRIKEANIII